MQSIEDFNNIMSDRKIFNDFVYTPLSQALKILEERRKDPELEAKIEKVLSGNIPDFFLEKNKCAVLGRHIATPNHESRMFISIAKDNGLHPVFFEFLDDKFTSNNSYKHSLAQLHVQKGGVDRDGDPRFEKVNIADFNMHNGKKLTEVKTFWNEPLIDFHRKLFSFHDYKTEDFSLYDGSSWFKNHGENAENFYVNFMILFVSHGILFENFLTKEGDEGRFTREVVLPSIQKVVHLTGVKPLIIPIGPLDIEEEPFWFYHLPKVKNTIPKYNL